MHGSLSGNGTGHLKLLFVCSKNRWRSLTAEKLFDGVAGHQVRSAGTEPQARIRVNAGHIGWADLIFVMEKKHERRLREKFGDLLPGRRLICLGIRDDYGFMDEQLVALLQARVAEHLKV